MPELRYFIYKRLPIENRTFKWEFVGLRFDTLQEAQEFYGKKFETWKASTEQENFEFTMFAMTSWLIPPRFIEFKDK